jgi:hypothetical protein
MDSINTNKFGYRNQTQPSLAHANPNSAVETTADLPESSNQEMSGSAFDKPSYVGSVISSQSNFD